MIKNFYLSILVFIAVLGLSAFFVLEINTDLQASTATELQKQIESRNTLIRQLEREIEQNRQIIQGVQQEARTLQSAIREMDATRTKLNSELRLAENQIDNAQDLIEQLESEMQKTQNRIDSYKSSLSNIIQQIDNAQSFPFLLQIFAEESLSAIWQKVIDLRNMQNAVLAQVYKLKDLNQELAHQQEEQHEHRNSLITLQRDLESRRAAIQYIINERQVLLSKTQAEESQYQRIIREKEEQRKAFEKELLEIESQLNFLIEPDSFPSPRKGILQWPLDNIVITQQFGGTQFAKANPHIYGRDFHPGTDFGVPTGTKVKSVASGVVIGTDNTDAYPGCYAWGKWVVVKHDNGLSSLYAHLSVISVSVGQRVSVGETIGLSGNTGISTGPHLHLTIYASQGVRISKYSERRPGGSGCAATNASGPFADLEAYLDPMSYLPSL